VDFGIAKLLGGLDEEPVLDGDALALDAPVAFATLTRTGTRLGTPYYMAPEQVDGAASVGPAADVWALGVVAFECLTGRHPFDGPDQRALFDAIRGAAHAPARALNGELPEAFDAWFARACAREPGARFRGAAEAADMLRAALGLPAERVTAPPHEGPDASGGVRLDLGSAPTVDASSATGSVPTRPSASRQRNPRRAALMAGAALVAVAATVLGLRFGHLTSAGNAQPLPPRSADLPPAPVSTIPGAAAAFAAGMQAFGDGQSDAARRAMIRASELDPSLAGAYLRRSLYYYVSRFAITGTLGVDQAGYVEAKSHRASASEYDRALIDAFEPSYVASPDLGETERRLVDLAARFPNQSEPLYWLASVQSERGDAPSAAESASRALRLDPSLSPAVGALRATFPGTPPSAAAAILDECVRDAPTAADCFGERTYRRGQAGDCNGMADDAHAWIAADDGDRYAYLALGEALFSSGAPIEGVRDALDALEKRTPADELAIMTVHDRAALAVGAGDFATAEADARGFVDGLGASPSILMSYAATAGIIRIAMEAGQNDVADDYAMRFLKRVDAWTPTDAAEIAMPASMLAHARLAGAITRETFVRERARRVSMAEAKLTDASDKVRSMTWLYGYAMAVETPDDARDAIAALSRYPPLRDPDSSQSANATVVGALFLRAGDVDRAIPYLRRGAGTCFMMNSVWTAMHARFLLADALVAKGERDEPRALYRSILDRWSAAKPRSVTADAIRARLKALGDR
jgi:serine/threonine-protein kinase